jgi:mannosyltransferase OCH1-like enzyme
MMHILVINLRVNLLHNIIRKIKETPFDENIKIFYNYNLLNTSLVSSNTFELVNFLNENDNIIQFVKNNKIDIIISPNFIDNIPDSCKLITTIKNKNAYPLDDLYAVIHRNIININILPIKKYNSIIPLNIYQTWHTKNLPQDMNDCVELLKKQNPEFKHHLYDDNQCRQFIKSNFNSDILNAYDTLVPGAYKADLWRCCILYIFGGIYLDIKYQCANGFKLIELTEKEYFVRDRPEHAVYNALIVVLPKNEILLKCIHQIVDNVKNNFYGACPLEPTGPKLVGTFFSRSEIKNMELYFKTSSIDKIMYNKIEILTSYTNYRKEHSEYKKVEHYGVLWDNKCIYVQQ